MKHQLLTVGSPTKEVLSSDNSSPCSAQLRRAGRGRHRKTTSSSSPLSPQRMSQNSSFEQYYKSKKELSQTIRFKSRASSIVAITTLIKKTQRSLQSIQPMPTKAPKVSQIYGRASSKRPSPDVNKFTKVHKTTNEFESFTTFGGAPVTQKQFKSPSPKPQDYKDQSVIEFEATPETTPETAADLSSFYDTSCVLSSARRTELPDEPIKEIGSNSKAADYMNEECIVDTDVDSVNEDTKRNTFNNLDLTKKENKTFHAVFQTFENINVNFWVQIGIRVSDLHIHYTDEMKQTYRVTFKSSSQVEDVKSRIADRLNLNLNQVFVQQISM